MSIVEKEVSLSVWIPENLKYRLDRATVEERTTLKDKVTRLLDENLPRYEMV